MLVDSNGAHQFWFGDYSLDWDGSRWNLNNTGELVAYSTGPSVTQNPATLAGDVWSIPISSYVYEIDDLLAPVIANMDIPKVLRFSKGIKQKLVFNVSIKQKMCFSQQII